MSWKERLSADTCFDVHNLMQQNYSKSMTKAEAETETEAAKAEATTSQPPPVSQSQRCHNPEPKSVMKIQKCTARPEIIEGIGPWPLSPGANTTKQRNN